MAGCVLLNMPSMPLASMNLDATVLARLGVLQGTEALLPAHDGPWPGLAGARTGAARSRIAARRSGDRGAAASSRQGLAWLVAALSGVDAWGRDVDRDRGACARCMPRTSTRGAHGSLLAHREVSRRSMRRRSRRPTSISSACSSFVLRRRRSRAPS